MYSIYGKIEYNKDLSVLDIKDDTIIRNIDSSGLIPGKLMNKNYVPGYSEQVIYIDGYQSNLTLNKSKNRKVHISLSQLHELCNFHEIFIEFI